MPSTTPELLKALLAVPVAALGTLHDGGPFVSMVPAAPEPGRGFLIHVSRLASHTRDLEADPRASLMWMAPLDAEADPLALPRVTVPCLAEPVPEDEAEAAARAYLARFPQAEPLVGFGDFGFWRLRPESARLVAGFGRARNLDAAQVLEAAGG